MSAAPLSRRDRRPRPRPLSEAVHEGWDIEVIVPAPVPRLDPSDYEAVSVACRRMPRYGRTVLEIDFDVFEGPFSDGRVLARLTLYLNWSKQPSPKSKLGRSCALVGSSPLGAALYLYRPSSARRGGCG